MKCLRIILGLLVAAAALTACRQKAQTTTDYSKSASVWVDLGKKSRQAGLRRAPAPEKEGQPVPTIVEGNDCESIRLDGRKERFLYFIIDPAFKQGGSASMVRVTVEYFDAVQGWFDLEYDGPRGPYSPSSRRINLQRSRKWETAEFYLRHARFDNAQNNNADFRLRIQVPEFFVHRVTVHRDDSDQGGEYAAAPEVGLVLGGSNEEKGLQQAQEHGDGTNFVTSIDGKDCRKLPGLRDREYFYFVLDGSFKTNNHMNVSVDVEIYDAARGRIEVHYDGWNTNSDPKLKGAYTPSPSRVFTTGTRRWRTVTFDIPDGRFENRQNGGADFRVYASTRGLAVRRVLVRRK